MTQLFFSPPHNERTQLITLTLMLIFVLYKKMVLDVFCNNCFKLVVRDINIDLPDGNNVLPP
jgi:hypothetical protein